ncbi:MAG: short-chain dehydrogenase [Chitinophagaceae bacterium]|nr:short-chain dehydrogenase [Chitinophagaceae bacterium]MBN8666202.1 short-chain dehydrogenase [Chitinophagales bacterium]MDX1955170.1 short-chain dehydrogenase [Chitinophagaceae bacterium]
MTNELIEQFILANNRKNKMLCIHFKNRESINGVFIFTNDYEELKKKNFWRIVAEGRKDEWQSTKKLACSRLFSGTEFTRLTEAS